MNLLCGFVSKFSVETALGRYDLSVSGAVKKADAPNPDGTTFESANCEVTVPGGGESPAFSVKVVPFTPASGSGILRTARIKNDLTGNRRYPKDVGIGFATPDTYTDGSGHKHDSCDSGLVRGDWVITLGVLVPGKGRDPVEDTMALAAQVANQLQLPVQPTTPYPDPN